LGSNGFVGAACPFSFFPLPKEREGEKNERVEIRTKRKTEKKREKTCQKKLLLFLVFVFVYSVWLFETRRPKEKREKSDEWRQDGKSDSRVCVTGEAEAEEGEFILSLDLLCRWMAG